MNFVFVSLQRINTDRGSTSTNLARELARQQHNVLYVNSPVDRKDFLFPPKNPYIQAHIRAIRAKEEPLLQLSPHLWMLHPIHLVDSFNWVPSTALFSWLLKINNSRLAQDIKQALDKLNFDEYILINDKDIFRGFHLQEYLRASKYFYLDRDYTIGLPYWRRHGPVLEPALMRKADAVFCNSLEFTARALQHNSNSYYLGNGFDSVQFSKSPRQLIPVDLAEVPSPRIGYVGAIITMRLDLVLLIELALARPSWNFVFIGWEDEAFEKSRLHELHNVFFLGRKHTEEVSIYIEHFDVCINPQVANDITMNNFPLKVLEYLALGKPVVATITNTMKEVFSEHVYLASNLIGYLTQIKKALDESTQQRVQQRIKFVEKFSWKNIAKYFIELSKQVEKKP